MSGTVTLAQVAAAAGVSVMTVSNVLNDKPGASDTTRRRVRKVLDDLDYTPNIAARGLKGGRTGVVGVMLDDLANDYALQIVRVATNEFARSSRGVLISVGTPGASHERERADMLTRGLVDGLILVAPPLEPGTLERLQSNKTPFVVIDPRLYDVPAPSIIVENYAGARVATEHLISLGHTRIACVTGIADRDSSRDRRRGFIDAMTRAGLPTREDWMLSTFFTEQDGFAATQELLGTVGGPPTAIFAAADIIAQGALRAAVAHGLTVPADLSVIGFDDLPLASQTRPPLTTIRQPLDDMSRLAAQWILSAIEGGPLPAEELCLPTRLIVRESTAHVRETFDASRP